MGRFFLIVGFIAVALLALRYWQQKEPPRAKMRKDTTQKDKVKSKGRLVRDPKTGDYHVESDDDKS